MNWGTSESGWIKNNRHLNPLTIFVFWLYCELEWACGPIGLTVISSFFVVIKLLVKRWLVRYSLSELVTLAVSIIRWFLSSSNPFTWAIIRHWMKIWRSNTNTITTSLQCAQWNYGSFLNPFTMEVIKTFQITDIVKNWRKEKRSILYEAY